MDYFSKKIFLQFLFGKIDVLIPGRYEFNIRRCFLARLTILYIARIEKKMLMMNLLKMYLLFSCLISDQHLVNIFY